MMKIVAINVASRMPELRPTATQLFCNYFALLPLEEMSEIKKVLNLIRGGGSEVFKKF